MKLTCVLLFVMVMHRKVTYSIMTEDFQNDGCPILCYNYSSHLFEKTVAGALGMCWYTLLLCYYRPSHWSGLCVNDRTGTFHSLPSRTSGTVQVGLQQAKRI